MSIFDEDDEQAEIVYLESRAAKPQVKRLWARVLRRLKI